MTMIFNYNLGPGGRYELEFVISSCIYKIDYFTILLFKFLVFLRENYLEICKSFKFKFKLGNNITISLQTFLKALHEN